MQLRVERDERVNTKPPWPSTTSTSLGVFGGHCRLPARESDGLFCKMLEIKKSFSENR